MSYFRKEKTLAVCSDKMLKRKKLKKKKVCEWELNYEGKYDKTFVSGCKHGYILFLRFVEDFDYKYCPNCGLKIKLAKEEK